MTADGIITIGGGLPGSVASPALSTAAQLSTNAPSSIHSSGSPPFLKQSTASPQVYQRIVAGPNASNPRAAASAAGVSAGGASSGSLLPQTSLATSASHLSLGTIKARDLGEDSPGIFSSSRRLMVPSMFAGDGNSISAAVPGTGAAGDVASEGVSTPRTSIGDRMSLQGHYQRSTAAGVSSTTAASAAASVAAAPAVPSRRGAPGAVRRAVPRVIIVNHAQWMDPASSRFLATLLKRVPDVLVVLVCESLPRDVLAPNVGVHLAFDRLDWGVTSAMVHALLGCTLVPRTIIGRICEVSQASYVPIACVFSLRLLVCVRFA